MRSVDEPCRFFVRGRKRKLLLTNYCENCFHFNSLITPELGTLPKSSVTRLVNLSAADEIKALTESKHFKQVLSALFEKRNDKKII